MEHDEVYGWFFDYACYMAWHEFERNHTVDAKSGRSLMTGVIHHTTDAVPERVHRVDFIQLLCLLADGDEPTMEYTKENDDDAEHRSPLERSLDNVSKLERSLEVESPLKDSLDDMKQLIKIQAVLGWVRENNKEAAEELMARLWPKQIRRTAEEKELVKTLSDIVGGKENKSFNATHSRKNFLKAIMPTLKFVNNRFKEPFLLQVLKKKRDMEGQKKGTSGRSFTCSQLRRACGTKLWQEALQMSDEMAKQVNSSKAKDDRQTAGGESPARVRKASSFATSSDIEEGSPAKRGKSIRSMKYGKSARPLTPSTDAAGQQVDWDDLEDSSDDDEQGIARTVLKSPIVRRSLGSVPGPPHSKRVRNRSLLKSEGPLRRPWSDEEEEALRKGIDRYGIGKWSEIRRAFNFDNRTNVQLKDKYRTLVKQGMI